MLRTTVVGSLPKPGGEMRRRHYIWGFPEGLTGTRLG